MLDKPKENLTQYTVKSLFSGAGGLDHGLEEAGLHVVEAYEYDEHACETLARVGTSDVYRCDISKLLLDGQLRTFAITATFPCTHFSTAGLQDGDELYLEAYRIIRCLQPEVFVIENVPAMRKFEIVMESFMNISGYFVEEFLLNAADCGAPQNRKRLILIGSKKPFKWNFTPVPPSERTYLKDIMEKGIRKPMTIGTKNRIDGVNKGQWPASVYDPEKKAYGPTCVAHYGKDQSDQLTVDPETRTLRSFTTIEYSRMQGFPDDYPFAGGKAATLMQIGNAVSPYMAKKIGKELLRYAQTADTTAYNSVHRTTVRKVVV